MSMKSLLVLPLAMASSLAHGDGIVAGTALSYLSTGNSSADLSFTTVAGSLGYHLDAGDGLTFTPEVRYGVGIGNDSVFGIDFDLDRFYGFTLRAEFDVGDTYVYFMPTYTNFRFEAAIPSLSSDEWDFGGGVGAGYRFSQYGAVEVTYERIESGDVFCAGLRLEI